jgi:hypothetical protein
MRNHFISIVLAALASGAPLLAQARPPWRWTPAERAAALRDPSARAARVRAHAAAGARLRPSSQPTPAADELDGNLNPELFFPAELYRDLVRLSFIHLPQVYQNVVRQRSSDLLQTPAEWDYFKSASTEVAALLAREHQLNTQRLSAEPPVRAELDRELARVRNELCAATAAALRSLRTRFDRDRFDRMLYEVVPPGHGVSFGSASEVEAHVRRRLDEEERCQ